MALVLSRRVGESIKIGENVTVLVKASKSGKVRLEVQAPRDVRVLRSELEKAA